MSEKPHLFPPPEEAACLYTGKVMHQRMRPFGHRFNYRVFSLMIDLDRLKEAEASTRLFSVNRFNWFSFHEKDHLDEGEINLAETARHRFRKAGLVAPVARLLLVCYPRIFGKVFNPLAVYYAYDAEGALIGITYEVRNTFGGLHRYVCPLRDGDMSEAGIRQMADKVFRVSPFVEMDMRYHFRMLPPGEDVRWRILETDRDGPLLSATFSGRHRALTSGAVLSLSAQIPLLFVTVLGGIHWEALKIWLKGAKFIPESEKFIDAADKRELQTGKFHSRLEPVIPLGRSKEELSGQALPWQLKQ